MNYQNYTKGTLCHFADNMIIICGSCTRNQVKKDANNTFQNVNDWLFENALIPNRSFIAYMH